MLNEIKNKYHEFGDAIVRQIIFDGPDYEKNTKTIITVKLNVYNWQSEKREAITLTFIDVIKFKFSETKKRSSTAIFEAYLDQIKDIIVCDFFALQVDGDIITEDPNSDFVIHCKEIKYNITDSL